MAYTYTRAQLVAKAQQFANTASQQSTPAAAIPYITAAQAVANCVMGRMWDLAVEQNYVASAKTDLDTTKAARTTLLMKADAALVSANLATGQEQLDYLTVAQGWSKLAESVATNALLSQQYNNNN